MKPWYVLAGNHDYDGDEDAQVKYSKVVPRWNFPSLYYNFTKRMAGKVSVQFFMIDTQVLENGESVLEEYGRKRDLKQLRELKEALQRSRATWKIVFGHHPIYTSKGKKEWLIQKLVPMMEEHKVAAYINGHVHTFNHVKSNKKSLRIHYFTVGSTGIQGTIKTKNVGGITHMKTYPTQTEIDKGLCGGAAKYCRGFAVVTVKGKRNMVLEFFNVKGARVYTSKDIPNPRNG